MRGSKAKSIRRKVYGDNSLRQKRIYDEVNHRRKFYRDADGVLQQYVSHTTVNAPFSLRAKYQKAKAGVA